MKINKKKFQKYFLLTKKKVIWFIVAWVVFVILHNLISALVKIEEALFFLLATIIIPLWIIIAIIYSLVKWFKK